MVKTRKHHPAVYCLMTLSFYVISILMLSSRSYAQTFRFEPGFDPQECEDLFKLNFAFLDTADTADFSDFLEGYQLHYRSQSVGLDNSSDIWIRQDSTVVIMLRGTTASKESILADFYCSMLPAKGTITLNKDHTFDYQLADDPKAAVHAGFLIGFAYLADHIQPKIEDLYSKGYRKIMISGHSQGGSLAYYFSAWLMQLRKKGVYKNLLIKTYASAPPKMANMYFAYDYDNANLSQWSFSIVNSADPVPEMPFTTQQVEIDMNEPNPILNLTKRFKEVPFLKRVFLNKAFNNMRKTAKKSSEAYQKYLGKYVGNFIHNSLPDLALPKPVKTTYFVRPGVPIILSANENYQEYGTGKPSYFHHGVDSYRFLLRQYYSGLTTFEPMAKE